jgi:hypothetical protein
METGECDFGLCTEPANQTVAIGGERRPACELHGAQGPGPTLVQTTTRAARLIPAEQVAAERAAGMDV